MIYLGGTVHHDGHGNVPTYAGCDCGCEPYQREADTEYWDKETYYEKGTK